MSISSAADCTSVGKKSRLVAGWTTTKAATPTTHSLKDEPHTNRPPIGEQTIHKSVNPVNTETTMRCDSIDPAVLDLDLQAGRRR